MQRLFDILFSGTALLILTPLFLVICIILKLSGEGEIFYLQQRVGIFGKKFDLYKFATMLKNSSSMGTGTITIKDDPRVLPIGKFLRKTKINELPQLLNVFLGHMSVIGPRPQAERCFDAFERDAQESIIKVRPGLSGIGSIIFRAEDDIMNSHGNTVDFYDNKIAPYKGDLEIWYVKNQSLFLYFTLIYLTIWVIVFPNSKLVWKLLDTLPKPPDYL